MIWTMMTIGAAELAPPRSLEPFGSLGWTLIRTTLVLVIVCILAYLVIRFVLRRILPQPGKRGDQAARLVVIDRLALEARRSLLVVKAGSKTLLIGLSDGQINLLCELDPAEWGDAPTLPDRSGFRRRLESVLGRSPPVRTGRDPDVISLDGDLHQEPDTAKDPNAGGGGAKS